MFYTPLDPSAKKCASVLRTLGAFGTKRLRRLTPSASRAEARSAFGAARLRRLSQVGFGISIGPCIEINFRKGLKESAADAV